MTTPEAQRATPGPRGLPLLLLLALGLGIWANRARMPDVVGAGADPADFSAERAMRLVESWAKRPRPSGSATHGAVVDDLEGHLVELGWDIQRQQALIEGRNITNLVGFGTPDARVWLVAHSDSVRVSPGAGDDGLGLSVLVEAARVLYARGVSEGLNVLVTDGEEIGLYGATHFVPTVDAPQLILNMEARGTEGPVYMFQTAGDDGPILDAWVESGCTAQASSLARTVYALLPNDTDFTVFRNAGWWGYDFAVIGGAWRYHTPDDRPEHLDPRSVQQLGDCVVDLVTAWLGRPLEGEGSGGTVYAQLFGNTWRLSPWIVRALALATAAVVIATRPTRLLRGGLVGAGTLILSIAAGFVLQLVVMRVPGALERPAEMEGPEPWYLAAAVAGVAIGGFPALVSALRPRWLLPETRDGALAVGVLVSALLALLRPAEAWLLLPGAAVALAVRAGRPLFAVAAAVCAGALLGPVMTAIYPALTTRMLLVLVPIQLVLSAWIWAPRRAIPR